MQALLVVDVQQALIEGAFREAEVLAAINRTTQTIRERGGLVIYIQHCHDSYDALKKGAPGWSLHQALDVRDDDRVVEKQASDSFYNTDLEAHLRAAGVDHLYVTGLQTEFCVDATCRSALSKGFGVTLVSDGHTTGDGVLSAAEVIAHHNYALRHLAHPNGPIQVIASEDLK